MKKISFAIVILLIITSLLGCTRKPNVDDNGKIPQIDPTPDTESTIITLYFGDKEANGLTPELREVEIGSERLEEVIIRELIKGPSSNDLIPAIPTGTKLLSYHLKDNIAYVNFSKEIKTNHWGGSYGDTLTIYSIVNSLTEIEGIDKVQFLIEGQSQEAIFGHIYTMEPLKREESIIIH